MYLSKCRQVSVKHLIVVGHTCQMRLMLECCCRVWQKFLLYKCCQGDECAAECASYDE